MVLTECYLTLLLIVGAPGSSQPTTYDNLRSYGTCIGRSGTYQIYISPYAPELVIAREFDLFRVQLPKQAGYYELQFIVPRHQVRFYKRTEHAELLPIGQIDVACEPKGGS